MGSINYHEIKNALKNVILNANLEHSHEVSMEGDILFDGFDNLIDIEINSRSVDVVYISQGSKARYKLLIVLTIWAKHLEKESAIKVRDELLSELEPELMKNRTFNDNVDTSWLLGGQNVVAFIEDESAFVAAGEIRISADVEIIT